MKKLLDKHSHLLHKLGLGLSFICAIHCLAMPFLLVAIPVIGNQFFSEAIELWLIVPSLIIGIFILVKDYKVHQQKLPLYLLSISFILILVHFLFHLHLLLTFSSIIMALSYFLNWRYHKTVCAS